MAQVSPLTRILVGVDMSKTTAPLAEFAIRVAREYGAELVFAFVVDEEVVVHVAAGYDPNKIVEEQIREASDLISQLVAQAREKGVSADGRIVDTPMDPAVGLARLAEEVGASEVLVAHKGRKLGRLIPLGSTATSLVKISPRPVLIVKPFEYQEGVLEVRPREDVPPEGLLRRIMIAVDDNVTGDMLDYAADLVKRAGKAVEEVYLIHIIEPREDENSAKRLLSGAANRLQSRGVKVSPILLESPRPSREILAAAEQLGVTLLLAGRTLKRRRMIIEYLTGTTLSRILAESEIPVLVYPLKKE